MKKIALILSLLLGTFSAQAMNHGTCDFTESSQLTTYNDRIHFHGEEVRFETEERDIFLLEENKDNPGVFSGLLFSGEEEQAIMIMVLRSTEGLIEKIAVNIDGYSEIIECDSNF